MNVLTPMKPWKTWMNRFTERPRLVLVLQHEVPAVDSDHALQELHPPPATRTPPFICAQLPQLVEMRGGDYFFIPSMTALRMIVMGVVDPT